MKKYVFSMMMMVLGSALFTSCLKDDDSDSNKDQEVAVTTGAYVVNNGSFNQNNGSLTYFDYQTLKAQQLLSGGSGLGDTPNDAYTKGDTIFIVGSSENTIFVVDKKDFSIISRVSTTAEMGEAEGVTPRHIIGSGDNLYFTTYGGYVGVLNTRSLKVTQKFQVGSAPEGLALSNSGTDKFLYVANSDYGNGNASISKINLATAEVEEIKNEHIQNPQEILAIGEELFVLDWGHYTEDFSQQLDAGLYRIYNGTAVKVIPDATGMGVGLVYYNNYPVGYLIVTFNYPYGSSKPTYTKFNTFTGSVESLTLSGDTGIEIFSPAALAVDPITGNILIASRAKDPDSPADAPYASFSLPGYVNIYTNGGAYIKDSHFETGIEPHMIGFTLGLQTITYK